MRYFQGCGPRRAGVRAAIHCCSAVVAIGVLLGCSQNRFSQTHYVGVVNPDTQVMQFYRFDLVGDPGWTRTKFVSAWYDTDTIEGLVGEMGMAILADQNGDADIPENPKAETTDGAKTKDGAKTIRYVVTGPEGGTIHAEDKRLAIVMSSDPEAITNAITELATLGSLSRLLKTMASDGKRPDRKMLKRLKAILDRMASNNTIYKGAKDLVDAYLASKGSDVGASGGSK